MGKLLELIERLLGLFLGTGGEKASVEAQLTGSYVMLTGEVKPPGSQGDTLLEYDVATQETKVHKFISGDWREL